MANTKYPSALKVKAPLAWLGGLAIGFSPLMIFYSNYLLKEHYSGNVQRKTWGEEKVFHDWMATSTRHSLQIPELLRHHPNYEYTDREKYTLRLNELNKINR